MGKVVVDIGTLAEQAYVQAMNQELRPKDRNAVVAVVTEYERLMGDRLQLIAQEKLSLESHVLRELVNDLRDLAVQYHGHQSLRGRISRKVQEVLRVGKCMTADEKKELLELREKSKQSCGLKPGAM